MNSLCHVIGVSLHINKPTYDCFKRLHGQECNKISSGRIVRK